MKDFIPRFPLGDMIEASISWLTDHFAFLTRSLAKTVDAAHELVVAGLVSIPPSLFILLVAAAVWRLSGRRVAIFTILGLGLIWNLGLWNATMETVALVVAATLIALMLGIPLGVGAALIPSMNRVVMPTLDLMQTMPAFVYLIPAIPFFGLGAVSAIFSTVIFAMPPAIRLTCLGIQQVPQELVEAADAFGANRRQKLFKLQLPLARPTIMAGINQTVMLSLSMVVIAAMIGAGGLGGEVWKAIQRFQPGKGFEAGLGVVIIAILFDRVTQKIGHRKNSSVH